MEAGEGGLLDPFICWPGDIVHKLLFILVVHRIVCLLDFALVLASALAFLLPICQLLKKCNLLFTLFFFSSMGKRKA